METVRDFIWGWGASKITADGDCSHEIKRCLLLERKIMTNLDNILKKQRHYFANKSPSRQSYDFSRASLIAQLVKNPPAMQETLVQFLGQEDPLEKG